MRRFDSLKPVDFGALVRAFPWTRTITEVHLHHTWRPRKRDYSGLATIEGMWRHHTRVNGWSDIAQHVSIAPDGTIWLGRNFNWAPASAAGFNGNAKAGPFMIEMIGDFDVGRETLEPAQRESTLAVIKAVQGRFQLPSNGLRFHNEMSSKSCPGSSQAKSEWVDQIEAFTMGPDGRDRARDAFDDARTSVHALVVAMNPRAPQTDDMGNSEHDAGPAGLGPDATGNRGRFARGLDARALDELSDHVINLTDGRLSEDGIIRSSPNDVDRIVDERLRGEAERAKDGKVRLLVWAHGGLVSEEQALIGALGQLPFWRANDVYPLFFIWETGLAETLKQMLRSAREFEAAPRGLFRDWMDERVEDLARFFGADKIWGGMKRSAERSAAEHGGARYLAEKLADLLVDHQNVELHLVGHSAGSIFQTQFLSALRDGTVVTTAQFLAPAIGVQAFKDGFAPALGNKVSDLTVYTMIKSRELADTVTSLYDKSLLYMVSGALEAKRDTPLLGLEESLRSDPEMRTIFGLNRRPASAARVVWSPSDGTASGSGSESHTHGGFDNDPTTMESVCRRILGLVNGEPIKPYARPRGPSDPFQSLEPDLPDHLRRYLSAASAPAGVTAPEPTSSEQSASVVAEHRVPPGRRRALCVGINNYRNISPLRGCLNDRKQWEQTLRSLGFEIMVLEEEDATAQGLLSTFRDFVGDSREGDALVFQFAGHGTQFPDASGDEKAEKRGSDSCLCAIDCGNGSDREGLIIDDELFDVLQTLPKGASFTAFFDCCHSGTMARVRAPFAPPPAPLPRGATPRGLEPTREMRDAYLRLKSHAPRSGARNGIGIQFGACQDAELAWEFDGSGHFTRLATGELPRSRGLSNAQFMARLMTAFGDGRRQTPKLDGDTALFEAPLALF